MTDRRCRNGEPRRCLRFRGRVATSSSACRYHLDCLGGAGCPGRPGPAGRLGPPPGRNRSRIHADARRTGTSNLRPVVRARSRPPSAPSQASHARSHTGAYNVNRSVRTVFPSTVDAPRAAASMAAALSTKMSGGVLLSHAVPRAVPSALKGLTSGFGMGPGVSPSPWPPKLYGDVRSPDRTSGTAQWTHAKSISRSQATRPISTGQLHTSPCFHLRPINPVV